MNEVAKSVCPKFSLLALDGRFFFLTKQQERREAQRIAEFHRDQCIISLSLRTSASTLRVSTFPESP